MTVKTWFLLELVITAILSSTSSFGSLHSEISQVRGNEYLNPKIVLQNLVKHEGGRSRNGTSKHYVNVDHFGAKGNRHDDSQAFAKAWEKACSLENAVLIIPKKKVYHLKPITFSGPCKPNLKMKPCTHAPTAVTFYDCTNLRVRNIRIKNAQQMQLSFQRCVNVRASRIKINAPDDSPNTDGIHVTATQNIKIIDSIIRTGDDCISIVSGSKDVEVKDVICGPGHGISIGSLGKGNSEDHVSDILVDGALFEGTDNGVRIKTWQGGYGFAKNIKFKNIEMHNVRNPVIIDQNYCDRKEPCFQQHSAVQVMNIEYINIQGTSASEKAINIGCSKTFPCQGILFDNVKLLPHRDGDYDVEASCENIVKLQTKGGVFPRCNVSTSTTP